jgi:glutaminyl-peptide cyclotransferase
MHYYLRILLIAGLLLVIVISCQQQQPATDTDAEFKNKGREVPAFSADSAYAFIEAQLAFGPRNPNSEGHRKTAVYLENKLRKYADNNVYVQRFTAEGYEETLELKNIIAAFNPEASYRILLCAHWDTRPRAEYDPDEKLAELPILGADDGGSGVGVLLEIARIMSEFNPPVGVDIILFDGEDYGHEDDLDRYFLGSRYWSNNPPVAGYMPRFGILLDMVGGVDAVFPREGYSLRYAPRVVDAVWGIAGEKGFSRFSNERGLAILDDHYILNTVYGLPTINIIHQSKDEFGQWGFPDWWHTHNDNIDIIDKQTLQEVGEVMLELIYNRLR